MSISRFDLTFVFREFGIVQRVGHQLVYRVHVANHNVEGLNVEDAAARRHGRLDALQLIHFKGDGGVRLALADAPAHGVGAGAVVVHFLLFVPVGDGRNAGHGLAQQLGPNVGPCVVSTVN